MKKPIKLIKDSNTAGSPGTYVFAKEYWNGDSRDGYIVNGDGYHYYRLRSDGLIAEAYELYEREDGTKVVSPLPEMQDVHWNIDLGFQGLEELEMITELEFKDIKEQLDNN